MIVFVCDTYMHKQTRSHNARFCHNVQGIHPISPPSPPHTQPPHKSLKLCTVSKTGLPPPAQRLPKVIIPTLSRPQNISSTALALPLFLPARQTSCKTSLPSFTGPAINIDFAKRADVPASFQSALSPFHCSWPAQTEINPLSVILGMCTEISLSLSLSLSHKHSLFALFYLCLPSPPPSSAGKVNKCQWVKGY